MIKKWNVTQNPTPTTGNPKVFTNQPKIAITDHQQNKLEEIKEFKYFFERINLDKTGIIPVLLPLVEIKEKIAIFYTLLLNSLNSKMNFAEFSAPKILNNEIFIETKISDSFQSIFNFMYSIKKVSPTQDFVFFQTVMLGIVNPSKLLLFLYLKEFSDDLFFIQKTTAYKRQDNLLVKTLLKKTISQAFAHKPTLVKEFSQLIENSLEITSDLPLDSIWIRLVSLESLIEENEFFEDLKKYLSDREINSIEVKQVKSNARKKFIVKQFPIKIDEEIKPAEVEKTNKYDSYKMALNRKKAEEEKHAELAKANQYQSFHPSNIPKKAKVAMNKSAPKNTNTNKTENLKNTNQDPIQKYKTKIVLRKNEMNLDEEYESKYKLFVPKPASEFDLIESRYMSHQPDFNSTTNKKKKPNQKHAAEDQILEEEDIGTNKGLGNGQLHNSGFPVDSRLSMKNKDNTKNQYSNNSFNHKISQMNKEETLLYEQITQNHQKIYDETFKKNGNNIELYDAQLQNPSYINQKVINNHDSQMEKESSNFTNLRIDDLNNQKTATGKGRTETEYSNLDRLLSVYDQSTNLVTKDQHKSVGANDVSDTGKLQKQTVGQKNIINYSYEFDENLDRNSLATSTNLAEKLKEVVEKVVEKEEVQLNTLNAVEATLTVSTAEININENKD